MKKHIKKYVWGGIPYFWNKLFNPRSKKQKYYKYILINGCTRYPFQSAEKYMKADITVHLDEEKNLPFVYHNNKKLYFPEFYAADKVKSMYRDLNIEQDPESGHRYVDSMDEYKGKHLLDIGAAEGIISLDAIELVDWVTLFECDPKWIEPLMATFEPWKEKVTLCKLYVSNKDSEDTCTLDTYFKDKPKDNIFLKMDIEGEEVNALEGAKNFFSEADNLSFAVCTYHNKEDYDLIYRFLHQYNCQYRAREGFFFLKHRLRPFMLRGEKFNEAQENFI